MALFRCGNGSGGATVRNVAVTGSLDVGYTDSNTNEVFHAVFTLNGNGELNSESATSIPITYSPSYSGVANKSVNRITPNSTLSIQYIPETQTLQVTIGE